MKKIGITGSLASGKTSASRILSKGRGPLFSADTVVKNLYKMKIFKRRVSKILKIKNDNNIKKLIKEKILKNKSEIKKIEKLIHPLVRKEMKKFTKKHKNKKLLFFEIPLLIESRLMNNFDIIFFIKAKKKIRLNRYLIKGGQKRLFYLLNNRQLNQEKKIKLCDHVVVNEKNLNILKKKLLNILIKYE